MDIFNLEKFNNAKIVLDVPYDKKALAKEYKARWSPDDKYWYIVHNKDNNDARQCFGNINVITIFKIKEIIHKFYEPGEEKHNELIIYYKNLRKELKNKLQKCSTCNCEYKFKHKEKHLISKEHVDYIKEHENDDFIL